LAKYYLKFFADKAGKPVKMTDEFLNLLKRHQWKGNIRELKNIIERAVILADDSPYPRIPCHPNSTPISTAARSICKASKNNTLARYWPTPKAIKPKPRSLLGHRA
jgi:two-component system NtrC family response regulator